MCVVCRVSCVVSVVSVSCGLEAMPLGCSAATSFGAHKRKHDYCGCARDIVRAARAHTHTQRSRKHIDDTYIHPPSNPPIFTLAHRHICHAVTETCAPSCFVYVCLRRMFAYGKGILCVCCGVCVCVRVADVYMIQSDNDNDDNCANVQLNTEHTRYRMRLQTIL